jgi:hypothetical protein
MAAGLASACVSFGGVSRTAGTIDRSAGEARNDSILLNILRASQHEPLYFYSISRVSGSGMEDFKFNLPPFTLGPKQLAAQRNYTFGADILDSQHSGSFDVALLDSKNFYQGMLAPLDLLEINLLLKQGFPRELVYRLVVQDITLYDDKGLHRYVNDPTRGAAGPPIPMDASLADILRLASSQDFNLYFEAAMTHGITTETYSRYGGPDDVSDAKPSGDNGDHGGPHGDDKKGAPSITSAARLCFDETLIEGGTAIGNLSKTDVEKSGNQCGVRPQMIPMAEASEPLPALQEAYNDCKKANDAAAAPTSAAQHSNRFCARFGPQIMAVQLNTRSLFGVFQYLGQVMNSSSDVELWGLGAANEPKASGRLLEISNSRTDSCFAVISRGATRYCIPTKGGDALKETFSIINALQALKTSPGDLPATQAVRIED